MRKLSLEYAKIRCLIVEDFRKTKPTVEVVYNKLQFEEILNSDLTGWEITKVYEPTEEVEAKIIQHLIAGSNFKKDDLIVQSKILKDDVLVNLVPIMTDMEIDLDVEEDREYIKELLSVNSEFVKALINTITDIMMTTMEDIVKAIYSENTLPPNIKKMLEETSEIEKIDNQVLDEKIENINDEIKEEITKLEIEKEVNGDGEN